MTHYRLGVAIIKVKSDRFGIKITWRLVTNCNFTSICNKFSTIMTTFSTILNIVSKLFQAARVRMCNDTQFR